MQPQHHPPLSETFEHYRWAHDRDALSSICSKPIAQRHRDCICDLRRSSSSYSPWLSHGWRLARQSRQTHFGRATCRDLILVVVVVLTDVVTRWWAGEAPKSADDRFIISDAYLKAMVRVLPSGLCFFAIMTYGIISTGTWDALPHRAGEHYKLFNHGSLAIVSEARYRHVIEGNLLFAIGMSLLFITLCYRVASNSAVPKAPEWFTSHKAARAASATSN